MFNLENFKITDTSFNGIYIGVVENVMDPLESGRCQVRVVGLHTNQKTKTTTEGIPSNELPWAIPANPITGGSVSGLGWSGVPVQGSWVLVMFIGNGDHNNPVYFATLSGIPTTGADTTLGFNDPDGVYPKYTGEPDWNKNARNTDDVATLKENGKLGGSAEPSTAAAPEYPKNTVFETPDNGIVVEYDSTPNKERWSVFHRASGSYMAIEPNGDTVFKSANDTYQITAGAREVHVEGADNQVMKNGLTITVTGTANIVATAVNLGDASGGKVLMNEDIIAIFNDHVHAENGTGGGITDATLTPMSTGEATAKTKAT